MRIAIDVDRNAALLAGHDRHGLHILDVPAASLSPEARQFLVDFCEAPRTIAEKGADYYLHTGRYSTGYGAIEFTITYKPSEPTVEVIHRLIAEGITAYAAARQKKEHEKEREKAATAEANRRLIEEWKSKPIEEWLTTTSTWDADTNSYFYGYVVRHNVPQLTALQEEVRRAETICKERTILARDQHRKAKAAEVAAEKAKVEKLRTWAQQQGSDLLKARLEHGYDWLDLAHTEYADKVGRLLAEASQTTLSRTTQGSRDELTAPSLVAMQLIDAIDDAIDNAGLTNVTTELLKVTPEDADDDDEDDPSYQEVVRLTIICPDGIALKRYLSLAPCTV